MKRKLAVFGVLGVALVVIAACVFERSESVQQASEETSGSAEASGSPLAEGSEVQGGSSVSSQLPIESSAENRRRQDDSQLLSPTNDGWQTEVIAEAALKQLKLLGKRLSERTANGIRLDDIVAHDCVADDLRPAELQQRYDGEVVVVRNWQDSEAVQGNRISGGHRGIEGLRTALSSWLQTLPESTETLKPHFKIVGVESGDIWRTKVLGELTSASKERTRQVNLTWSCDWRYDDKTPLLTRIRLLDYREADVENIAGKWFVEQTTAVIGKHRDLVRQLGNGHHYWLQRIERALRFDTSVRNGLAVGDVNGDGLDDLYVCQPPGLPNRLFVQNKDGTATESSREYNVDLLDQTGAALLCDFDNDADQDLVLGTPAGVLLYENTGDGKFAKRVTLTTDYDVQSLSAIDYDRDGRLDLFACVYRTAQPKADRHFLYRDAVGGGSNRLFRNKGPKWAFEDVTDECGLSDGADRYSLAASWQDYDDDGDDDLYVANDFGPNYLYENRDGRFVNVAKEAGVVDIGSGMSVSWGDYNRDGKVDLYVGNMFSSAGQRVTTQAGFRAGESEEIREVYRRLAKGNSLFENLGDGRFKEVGGQAQVELGRWAWSSLFTDLNNDGWEDLLVANGYITTEDTGDL